MIVFRLAKEGYTNLDGKGAALYPGRWNKERIPCLYTSQSPSLAQLEVMVNVEDWRLFVVKKYYTLEIEVQADKIIYIPEAELPTGWDSHTMSEETQQFGSNLFLSSPDYLGFAVPSAVNKLELNYILNPNAKDFDKHVTCVRQIPFQLDIRLIKGKKN